MAAVLSFFWPGLGHIYVGYVIQGLFWMVLIAGLYAGAAVIGIATGGIGFVLVLVAMLFHLIVMIDAQRAANRKRKKEMAELAAILRK